MTASSLLATGLLLGGALLAGVGLARLASGRDTGTGLPVPRVDTPPAPGGANDGTAVFAGGCFWGVEAVFRHVKGVQGVVSGYAGGRAPSPSYEDVSTGTTGHAEAVSVRFDPQQITYGELLQIFLSVAHNPTELNRQGPDHGTQYRSAIFYRTPGQEKTARSYLEQLAAARAFPAPIVTDVVPFTHFYPAEDHHQDYLARHPRQPYIVLNDAPKLLELKRLFPDRYRP